MADMTSAERDQQIAALIRTRIAHRQTEHASAADRFDRALIVKTIEGLREALALVDPNPQR